MDQLVGTEREPGRREKLLAAARMLILERGFAASTVDRICEAAGVTKGSFFHYFDDKEALAREVAARFASDLVQTYGAAPFRAVSDPLERVHAYIDFTIEVCRGPLLSGGCAIGALSVELAKTQPDVREICSQTFGGWAEDLADLLREASARRKPASPIDPDALARLFLATVEGTLILARAHADPDLVSEGLGQFRDYVRLLFGQPVRQRRDRHARPTSRRR